MVDQNIGTGAPPAKRRRFVRTVKSCEQCRSRKVRCDQGRPCGPCRRSRDGLTCSYRQDGRDSHTVADDYVAGGNPIVAWFGTDRGTTSAVASPDVNVSRPGPIDRPSNSNPEEPQPDGAAHATIKELLARIKRLEEHHHGDPQGGYPHADPARPVGLQSQSLRQLEERVDKLELAVRSNQAVGANLSGQTDSFIQPTTPRLRNTPDKVKLFGQSHWVHTAEQIRSIGTLVDSRHVEPSFAQDRVDMVKKFEELRGLRQQLKSQQRARLNEPVPNILGTIPPRNICDDLVNRYVRTFEVIHRILHLPTFWKQYGQFWESPQSAPNTFVYKLILILSIGTTFVPLHSEFDRLGLLAQKWVYAAHWWLTGPSEKSTQNLDGLQVACLLVIARLTSSVGRSAAPSTASLMTMAMSMGLHRDPSLFPVLSPFQVEMRARLWAAVVELVMQSSLHSDTPLFLSLQGFDAHAPSNVNDASMDDGHGSVDEPGTDTCTDVSVQLFLSKSLRVRMEVLRFLHDFNTERSYETAVKLGGELRSACRDVAAFFQTQPPRFHAGGDFHRKYLDMYLRRHIMLLHRPFIVQVRYDPRFYLSRKMCLESSMAMASYSDALDLPAEITDDFSRLMVRGSGVFRGALSIDVVVTLGFEVVAQLLEDGPSSPNDPAGELARAGREPIMRRLEHVREQVLQVNALGYPRTKGYNFLSALLPQIRALERGEDAKAVVYDSILKSMQRTYEVVHAYSATHAAPAEAAEVVDSTASALSGSDEIGLDLEDFDFNNFLDPFGLLNLPDFTENNNPGV